MSWKSSDGPAAFATFLSQMRQQPEAEPLAEHFSESLNTFCRDAIAAGPISSGFLLVISGNTTDKAAAAERPLPMDHARPYLTRCGQERVLYHDTDGRYWDILYRIASREILSVQHWEGPAPAHND